MKTESYLMLSSLPLDADTEELLYTKGSRLVFGFLHENEEANSWNKSTRRSIKRTASETQYFIVSFRASEAFVLLFTNECFVADIEIFHLQ